MAELEPKRVEDSITKMVQIVFPNDCNGQNRLFGGRLMEWMDVLAAVVARRHSNSEITTASVDTLQFKGPAHVNDTIVLRGKITFVGRTSMEVRVDVYTEELSGKRSKINTAYFTEVALDDNERPRPVPGLICETEEEKREFEAGAKRREAKLNSLKK